MSGLPEGIEDWLAIGHPGTIAAVAGDGRPVIVRFWGIHAADEGTKLEVFVPVAQATLLREALESGPGTLAANVVEAPTYRSLQFKGPGHAREGAVDHAFVSGYLTKLSRGLELIGMPPGTSRTMINHYDKPGEFVCFELRIDACFDQSPRPGAGASL